jgi:peptide/nickel transport system substrate-binding protein
MGISRTVAILMIAAIATAQTGGELRFSIRGDPRTLDPLLASEEVSETIRYLTGGVLIRFNRQTQKLEPELAKSWKVSRDGKRIDFDLRPNLRFSDGAPFEPADVVATVRRMMTPGLQSGIAEAFRSTAGELSAQPNGPNGVSLTFSTPVGGLELLFDQLAISSSRSVTPGAGVLGPFTVVEHKSGQYVLLKRNPNYWKTAPDGRRLPRLDAVRLEIQANRDTELLRFRRGELHLVDKLEPEAFERLNTESPTLVRNAGSSLDSRRAGFSLRTSAGPSRRRSIVPTSFGWSTADMRIPPQARSRRPTSSGSTARSRRSVSTLSWRCGCCKRMVSDWTVGS